MGYYNTEHRERLRLIAHVQGRAFSLAAIKETLDHWTEGRSLGHLLGVSHAPTASCANPNVCHPKISPSASPEWTSPTETSSGQFRYASSNSTAAELVIANEAFVDLGAAVAGMGIPVSEILDEHEALMIAV